MKYKIIILAVVLIILFEFTGCSDKDKEDLVITREEAIKIAQEYVDGEYKQDFSDYEIGAVLEDDIWVISYVKKRLDDEIILGGGGPEVKIKESDGKVVSCMLQK